MDADDIYAYEQEMQEPDEWEEMHSHEIEAAEEELRAMEAAEHASKAKPQSPPPTTMGQRTVTTQDVTLNLDTRFAETEERVRSVLERCATALGESESQAMEDTEMLDDYVARKEKATKLDPTTAQFLLSRPPIDSDSMSIILPTGERRFLRKRVPTTVAERRPVPPNVAASALLPIGDLMEALEKRQIEAAINADKHSAAKQQARTSLVQRDCTLWLDKYKPHRFVDLLSDEKTNREVLSWIKQWDGFVFPGKKTYQPTWSEFDGPFSGANPSSGGSRHGNNGGFGKQDHSSTWQTETNDPRPREKIILLCGPPGAGKTTLASIVARHAGYNPIEINASDDRTTGVLKNKILNAMEMQSIWGDQKPNCIILDEIDGAMNGGDGKSAIAAIQEIISTPLYLPNKDAKNGKKSSGRQSNKHPLTRPLICICNDQYASVLRPLRKLAKIFVLDTPNSQRLVSRLKVICRDEGIKSSTGALATLSTNGGNDIRYCVNALQFQSTQTKNITAAVVTSGLIGQKDHSRGVFETLDMVFYQSAKSKAASALTLGATEQIDEAAHALGNFPLLINALDENLPRMIFNDPTMSKICDAFEWMGLADSWDTAIRAEQQFALMPFIPFAARAVHLACCTSSRRRVEYPNSHADASKKRDKTHNILQAFAENSQLHQSMRNSADVLVVDVVPWLLATLTPNIRHATANLQSPEEKEMVTRLIDLMATLGLSFRPKYLPDGSEDFTLEPPLHEIVSFRDPDHFGQLFGAVNSLPLAVRKFVTREVELAQMRKTEASELAMISAKNSRTSSAKKTKPSSQSTTATTVTPTKAMTAEALAKQIILPELSEQQEAEKLEIIRKRNPFAFAHREAKRKRTAEMKEQQQQQEQQQGDGDDDGDGDVTMDDGSTNKNNSSTKKTNRRGVRYRFNEGYTSGIKTPVYMRDFL